MSVILLPKCTALDHSAIPIYENNKNMIKNE